MVSTFGEFQSSGGLMLGSLKSLDDLSDGIQVSDLKRGSLMSNGSLSISGSGSVVGNLRTAGAGSVTGVTLDGTLEQGVSPEDIPLIRIADYDPAGKPEIVDFNRGGAPPAGQTLNVAGLARYTGNMRLNQGLVLDGGVLYVDGDLTVQGGVRGTGAVFCTGRLTVTGESNDLGSDSMCALVSGGDLTISGRSASSSQFRGLVYSAGDVNVSDVTVVGAMVGAKPASGGTPTMRVERANVVYDAAAVDLSFQGQFSGFVLGGGLRGNPTLRAGTSVNPATLWQDPPGRFRYVTDSELHDMLLIPVGRPSVFKTWAEMTPAERSTDGARAVASSRVIVNNQVDRWNGENMDLQRGTQVHIDLNRFVRLQSSMKILKREFSRL